MPGQGGHAGAACYVLRNATSEEWRRCPSSREGGYVVRSVVHAAQVLRAFQSAGEALRLRDVVERTGLGKGLCFRLLHTLHHVGLVEKVDAARYRLTSEVGRRRRYRIGYAAQGQDTSFPREVLGGLQRAADRENVELIVVDNRYQAKIALRNAEHLVRERVDLVIEFQTDEAVAPAIAATYLEAHIPLIAIDVPHPGATYFGANNYQAGLLAGRHLGQWAKTRHAGARGRGAAARARPRGLARARAHERGAGRPPGDAARHSGRLPHGLDRLRRAVQARTREGAEAHPGVQRTTRARGRGERPECPGCRARLSGSRPRGHLCDRRAQRGARRPGRAQGAADAARRVRWDSFRSVTATAC